MRKRILAIMAALLLLPVLLFPAAAQDLIPVGQTVGLALRLDGVYVVRFDADAAPAREAGLKVGDRIVSVDGAELDSAETLRSRIAAGHGADLILRVRRGEKDMSFTVRPVSTETGWRLGVYVQDRIEGLGTVTFYDPQTGAFGALGHGVSGGGERTLEILGGTATRTEVVSVRRGEAGRPGELRGAVDTGEALGRVEENSDCGVFGHAEAVWDGVAVPAAEPGEVTTGPAELLCNVSGSEIRRCAVEIEALSFAGEEGRDLRLRVTDPELLAATGGIVQGMSGSPILQNGRLIGAVTHVLIGDPTRGYGIFIGHMLEVCG